MLLACIGCGLRDGSMAYVEKSDVVESEGDERNVVKHSTHLG